MSPSLASAVLQVEVTKEITPPEEAEALDIVEEIGDALEARSKIKITLHSNSNYQLAVADIIDGWSK